MRGIILLWTSAIALVFVLAGTNYSGPQAAMETPELWTIQDDDGGESLGYEGWTSDPREIIEKLKEDLRDGELHFYYQYGTAPEDMYFFDQPGYLSPGHTERSSLWMPIDSVGQIPEGFFVLGPYVPEGYLQHYLVQPSTGIRYFTPWYRYEIVPEK